MSDDGQPEDESDVAPEAPPEPDPEPEAEPEPESGPEPDAAEPESEPEPATGEPDETMVAEAAETQPSDEPVIGSDGGGSDPITGSDDEVLEGIAGVRAGVEAMLPDLAAAAREETVLSGLAEVRKSLDEVARRTRRADDHVAELHAENQRLRAGELASATLPMIRDVVRLHDEVTRLAEASHPEARADIELIGSRLLDTLARWGLSPFAPAAGEKLDASRHQGVGRVPSSDGEPGTIATVRRPGFAHDDGRTFRPAEVEVFVAPPPPPTPEPAPTPEPETAPTEES